MDQVLSQEELNALLSGMDTDDSGSGGSVPRLSLEEQDAVGEISNISMGTAATTLSTLLNQRVLITTPSITFATWDDISNSYDRPCVFIQISYIDGLDGNNVLIMKESDVKIITDLMMGGDGTNTDGELSELHLSAICEAMNQMMGSAATSLSSMLEKKVDISPPVATLVDLNDTIVTGNLSEFLKGEFARVSFKLVIGDLIDSELMQLYPFEFAKSLYQKFTDNSEVRSEPEPAPRQQAPAPAQQAIQQMPSQQQGMMMPPQQGMPPNGQGMAYGGMQAPYGMPMPYGYGMPMQDMNVQPAQFQSFAANISPLTPQENIDLIMDVPLEVTVELGRTNKSIKEILDFAPGTIIELNRLAGEAIDVLVNGKFVAKGEVVVIEDSFGIRVTEIVRDKK